MERNADVEAAVEAMLDAMKRGDAGAADALMADQVSVVIGTDDGEWWDGRDRATAAIRGQLEATGGFALSVDQLRGYGGDGFGWFEVRGAMAAEDEQVPVRMTGALHQEAGGWKFVQFHASVGIPNAEFGLGDLPV